MMTKINMSIAVMVIFDIDNWSSVHVGNKKKCILILGKCPADGWDDTEITVGTEYCINFIEKKIFCSSLHYNESNSFFYVNGVTGITA